MINQSALIEVGDELFHRKFLTQSFDTIDAVIGIAEHSYVLIDSLVGDLLYSFLQLLVGFVTSYGIRGKWLDQFACHTEEVHQTDFTFLSRPLSAFRNMDGKRHGDILLRAICSEALTVYAQVFA